MAETSSARDIWLFRSSGFIEKNFGVFRGVFVAGMDEELVGY